MTSPPSSPKAPVMRRLGAATVLMAASVFLSRVVGFVREVVIAAQHGATGATDAYYAAFTLPDLLNYFLAGGIMTIAFIPLFSQHLSDGDEEGGWRLFSTVATVTGGLVGAMVLVGLVAAPSLVPLLVPGFDQDQLDLCVRMTRIVMPGMLCFSLGGLVQATLMVRERFAEVAAIPIVYNLLIIAGGVLLEPWVGVEGFAWGALAGAVVGPLGIPLWASRGRLRFRPNLEIKAEGFRRYLKLVLPLMMGVSLITLDEWFLRYFGSSLDQGTISWLNNARRLMLVPVAIVGQAAGQAAMPYLSNLWSQGRHDELARTLTSSVRSVLFYAVLAAGALIALARPIVFTAFERGGFTPTDATGTATLLMGLSLGVAAWSVQGLVARGFYANHDTLRPMLLGTVVAAASVPLYMAMGAWLAAPGLALASSLAITANALALMVFFRRWCAPLDLAAIARTLALALACAAPAAAAAWAATRALEGPLALTSDWQAALTLALGAALYGTLALGIAYALKVEELAFIKRLIARLRRR